MGLLLLVLYLLLLINVISKHLLILLRRLHVLILRRSDRSDLIIGVSIRFDACIVIA